MPEPVRFHVSNESEVGLQLVMVKLGWSRNQAAHFCMSIGVAAINSMIPSADQNVIAEKIAERIAPGIERAAQGALAILMQQQNLQSLLGKENSPKQ